MSFIPSFILSALIFCNAKVPGGWDEASFTEGIYCSVPTTDFTVSFEENTDKSPALKNAAAIFTLDSFSLKLAAGSLAVSGTGGSDQLSASLPAKDDASKPLSLFAGWKALSLYYTSGRMLIEFCTGHSGTLLQNALTAGWTHIDQTKDGSWYLRYPWHTSGNLHSLTDTLTARIPLSQARLETTGTVSISLPDLISPAAGCALDLLLKAGGTETTLAFSAAPAHFMTSAGTFTSELLDAKASFAFKAGGFADEAADESADKAESAFKTAAGFTVKQPAAAHELSKSYVSAALSYSLKKGDATAGVAINADKVCFKDGCREAELSPTAELTLFETGFSVKGKILPFQDRTSDTAVPPELSVKISRTHETLSLAYTALFSGTTLQAQAFSLSDKRGPFSLSTEITAKLNCLSWNLSLSKAW